MRITSYNIRTYAQLDTWSHGTKRTQTNPISPPGAKKLLDELNKHRKYRAAGPLTWYISTNQGPMRYHAFRTKGYGTSSDAAERVCNNVARERLKGSATIWTSPASSAALPLSLCRLNNKRHELCLQNHWLHEKSTCNLGGQPGCTLKSNET